MKGPHPTGAPLCFNIGKGSSDTVANSMGLGQESRSPNSTVALNTGESKQLDAYPHKFQLADLIFFNYFLLKRNTMKAIFCRHSRKLKESFSQDELASRVGR